MSVVDADGVRAPVAAVVAPQTPVAPTSAAIGWITRSVAAVRVVQLAAWPLELLAGAGAGLEHPWLAALVYTVQAAWSLVWSWLAFTRRHVAAWTVALDVPIAAVCLVVAGLACYPADATTWANAAVTPAIGTAIGAAVGVAAVPAATAVVLLIGAYLAGLARALDDGAAQWGVVVANCATLAGFAALGWAVVTLAAHVTQRSAVAEGELAQARAQLAAAQSREDEHARRYRLLHDTVLSTLAALARGGLDIDDAMVRQRCAADADFLRALITADGEGGRLAAELATVARSQAGLGLRVQVHCADIPPHVPDPVIDAMAAAAREALNNVVKHAGVRQARLTARGDGTGGFTVTIADQGCGFDPAADPAGTGLRQSITARLVAIGGNAEVDSGTDQGTSVQLQWPAR